MMISMPNKLQFNYVMQIISGLILELMLSTVTLKKRQLFFRKVGCLFDSSVENPTKSFFPKIISFSLPSSVVLFSDASCLM